MEPLYKNLQAEGYLKKTTTQVFSSEVQNISKKTFFTEHLRWVPLYFFKKL